MKFLQNITFLFYALSISLLWVLTDYQAYAQIGRGDRISGSNVASRSPVLAQHGMVASSHPLATQAGLEILKKGGSAVDAAIAANAVLGVVEPNNCGIGGDLFAIVWSAKDKKLYGLNASGRSPRGLTYQHLKEKLGSQMQIPLYGPLSVSAPGAVDGWFVLHGRFGKLSMQQILQPGIAYAREGTPVAEVIAYSWRVAFDRLNMQQAVIGDMSNLRNTFLINGQVPKEGEVFKNPDLARTYEQIAKGGRDAFYKGTIADRLDAYSRKAGLYLRKDDLANTQSTWVEPVSVNYRGYDVYELPPNGQGIAVLQMLNILESYDLKTMGHNSADYLHTLIEAKKLAFEDRARFYADPAFSKTPLQILLSKEYAAKRRRLINSETTLQKIEAGEAILKEGDTVYLTVADDEGNVISLIQSNMLEFGSGIVPDGLGFVLQNRGSSFSMQPGHANVYEPGKRPFHTIIPGFVLKDSQPFLSFGVMGGAMQPQGHVQVLCNIIDFGMNVQAAGDAARFSHSGSSEPTGTTLTEGGNVALESSISAEVRASLQKKGHQLIDKDFFGGYQAIYIDSARKVYHGASEMRKDGQAAGY